MLVKRSVVFRRSVYSDVALQRLSKFNPFFKVTDDELNRERERERERELRSRTLRRCHARTHSLTHSQSVSPSVSQSVTACVRTDGRTDGQAGSGWLVVGCDVGVAAVSRCKHAHAPRANELTRATN